MNRFYIVALVLLICSQLSTAQKPQVLPQEVIEYMGSREVRYYHLFFHSTRLFFYMLGPKQQHAIRNLGWEPPRPASAYNSTGGELVLPDNNNGEDFLYMHWKMIQEVNRISQAAGSTYRVRGWVNIPPPNDQNWPVPDTYEVPDTQWLTDLINLFKSDDFYWDEIRPRDQRLSRPEYLRTLTLGELGSELENEIHFFAHNRFSEANPVGYRVQNPLTPVDYVEPKWDDLRYDWLGDFYGAHVHPTFWMIHGWVDNKMELWRKANNYARIYWVGTWEGGPEGAYDDLAKVSKIKEDTAEDEDAETIGEILKLLAKLANKDNS
jgi:hypothetical protein